MLQMYMFFYKKNIHKKNEPQKPKNLKKILRESLASNALAETFKNADFSCRLFKSGKIK